MLFIVLVLLLIVLFIATFFWALKGMMTHVCPDCLENSDNEENLIPVIPFLYWWCPVCSRLFKNSLFRGGSYHDDYAEDNYVEDEEPPTIG